MRIGLNSGPVIVGAIGDDLRMDYTAVGDTTNLASRIQTMAQPVAVLLSGNTQRLVRDFFDLKSLGKEEPPEAYELLKPRAVETRIGASVAKGLTRFVGRRRRKVTLPLWRALLTRDRMCQFPGCGRTRHLVTHHIRHWAEGGETEPGNLILVCPGHHWAVHEGGCLVEGLARRGLVFRRPDGRILPMCPAPASFPEEPVQALKACHRALGLEIDRETGASGWCGETMDYELAVSGLLDAEDESAPAFAC